MSGARLHEAVLAALKGDPLLRERLTGMFPAAPVRAAEPYGVVGDPQTSDWSTKDAPGREARIAIELHETGETPVVLRELVEEVSRAVWAMPAALGEGWGIVSRTPLRERIARGKGARWTATIEWRVRMLRHDFE
ncbi:DUF3168 domain-containing protein [Sphingomonas sp.]